MEISIFLSGIISSIAFSPSKNGLLATGSYSQTTALYREDNMELLYVLHGQEGGVTQVSWDLAILFSYAHNFKSTIEGIKQDTFQVQFSKDGNFLYTGGRKVKGYGQLYATLMCASCNYLNMLTQLISVSL